MRVNDKALVLQSIKYGDKKLILKLYTRHHGLLTVSAAAAKTASSKIRPGSILPMSLVEVELILKQNKEIHQLTEANSYVILANIPHSLSKLTIAQFLNEILIKSLKEQGSNSNLFEFVETCLHYLNDIETGFENLHLYFLSELTKYLGFEPQNNYSARYPFFDCREGQFSSQALALPLGLNRAESQLFSEFLRINSLHEKISNGQRQDLLDMLLCYYKLHLPGFNDIKSLEVLREVIAG